jgi:hypothetical protein
MGRRRVVLLGGLALLVATAVRPVYGDTELEATEYAGSTTGGWTCGPVGRAKYAGVGAELKTSVRPRSHENGRGWSGTIGAGVEYERVTVTKCDPPCSVCRCQEGSPPNRVMAGLGLRGGYHMRWFGLELGMLLYEGWREPDDTQPAIAAFPQLELSVGPQDVLCGVVGIGSPLATTYRRPGLLYGGFDVTMYQPHTLQLRAGLHRTGPSVFDSNGFRLDGAWRFAVTESLRLRVGGSLGTGGKRSNDTDYEGSFGLVTNL